MQRVLAAQFEVVLGEIGLLGEALIFKIGSADLGGILGLSNAVAYAAPEIGFPGGIDGQRDIGAAGLPNGMKLLWRTYLWPGPLLACGGILY